MLLVDASVYIFRAFYSLPDTLTDAAGAPANAIYGYTTFLCQLLAETQPRCVAVAFDESLTTSFRNHIHAQYKANRELPPAALVAQIGVCRRLTDALGVTTLSSPTYEADDLIGTLAAAASDPVTLVTSDKDLAQLLTREGDILWDYARGVSYDAQAIRQRFGVAPAQIADYLALVGDPVDNIPGVPGIGAKTAAALLALYPDLDALYGGLDRLGATDLRGAARLGERLARCREQAFMSRQLARIVTDVALEPAEYDTRRRPVDVRTVDALCGELGLGETLRMRMQRALPA